LSHITFGQSYTVTASNCWNFSNITVTYCGSNVWKVKAWQSNANQQGRLDIRVNGSKIGKSCWNCYGYSTNQQYAEDNGGCWAIGGNSGRWVYIKVEPAIQKAYGYFSDFTCSSCTAPTAPTSISGTTSICSGSSTTLTASGGSNGSGANYQWGTGSTVGGGTIVQTSTSTSYTTPALSSNQTYWVRRIGTSSGCTNTTGGVTKAITVTAAPSAGTLSGTQAICVGGSTTFSSTVSGGSWSSNNTGIATINSSTGVISGVATGTATITYTKTGTGGCSNATATRTVTVTAAPSAGTLSGTQGVCVGSNTTFSSTVSGGSWSSNNTGIATINSSTGVISGVAAGTATITYTKAGTGGCSNATATRTVTVTAANTSGSASSTPTLCINTALTNITHTTTGATGISNNDVTGANGLPTGVKAVWASNTITISGTPSASGAFSYSIPLTGGCGSVNATGTITVNVLPEINLLTLHDGHSVANLAPEMDWSSSGTGTLDNILYIDSVLDVFNAGTSYDVNTASTYTLGSNLSATTIYYWGVEVTDDNCTNRSIVRQFTVTNPSQGGTFDNGVTVTSNSDGAQSVFGADIDGDGDMDLISASAIDNQIMWYENDGSESFTEHQISASADAARFAYPVDLDGDGDMDVISASSNDDQIMWYENDGSENFTEIEISANANGARMAYPVDLDGDGDMDIISASAFDDQIMWYENDGSENFTEIEISANADRVESIYYADLDGDGDIDILSAGHNDNQIMWYENDGNESFTEREITANAEGAIYVYAADIDKDGDIDVLSVADVDNQAMWYENDGSPSNGGWTEHEIANSLVNPSSIFSGDLDNDGYNDVIVTTKDGDEIISYGNDGSPSNGGWINTTITSTADGIRKASLIDLDSDGDLDIVGADYIGNKIQWYQNNVTTLPVTLLYFKANEVSEGVLLSWKTAMEINNDYFILEKSLDGLNWFQIATVSGAGNSVIPISYTYIDTQGCNGNCYYQLTQVDFDGQTERFEKVLISTKKVNENFSINVNPNPIQNNTEINFEVPENGDYNFKIVSTIGQIVFEKNIEALKGKGKLYFDSSQLSKGIYYFILQNKQGDFKQQKVLK
jgi:hypothetical protein